MEEGVDCQGTHGVRRSEVSRGEQTLRLRPLDLATHSERHRDCSGLKRSPAGAGVSDINHRNSCRSTCKAAWGEEGRQGSGE